MPQKLRIISLMHGQRTTVNKHDQTQFPRCAPNKHYWLFAVQIRGHHQYNHPSSQTNSNTLFDPISQPSDAIQTHSAKPAAKGKSARPLDFTKRVYKVHAPPKRIRTALTRRNGGALCQRSRHASRGHEVDQMGGLPLPWDTL
jgi:hypothetical protein